MITSTKMIGLKEFRTNITTLWKTAQKKGIRYIVMHHSRPVFEVNPVMDDDILTKLATDIAEAREQAKRGHVHTQAAVLKRLGHKQNKKR